MNKVNWMTSTHLSSKKTLTNGPALTLKFLIKFINLHTRENQYLSLRYIMRINASTNTPFYTHISSYVVWRVHPQACFIPSTTIIITSNICLIPHNIQTNTTTISLEAIRRLEAYECFVDHTLWLCLLPHKPRHEEQAFHVRTWSLRRKRVK